MFWYKGCSIVYFSGDVQKLKDDLAIVKPTVFLSVPRLYSRFYEVLKQKFSELQGFTKTALEYALSTKLDNLQKNGSYTHRVYDRIFFAKTKEALGGRCRLMVSGSAPLLPEVQNFLKVVLCAPLVEGYGQTESTGAILFSAARDPIVRHVGGPVVKFSLFSQTSNSSWSIYQKCSISVLTLTSKVDLLLEDKSGLEVLESSLGTIKTKRKLKKP